MSASIELLGLAAATATTLCWVPQIHRIWRHRQTADISLATNAFFAFGVLLWLVYGVLIGSWPVIGANAMTLGLVLAILGMKLRYG